MIVQVEHITHLDWTVYILHKVSCKDNNAIINYLQYIDCPSYLINEALTNLKTCNLNSGLTYSNVSKRESIVVISNTTSIGEYVNTITHELHHLTSQIRNYNHLSEEQAALICGNINMKVYRFIKKFIKKICIVKYFFVPLHKILN